MSTFPKPRRKGWRFLREGEKLRRTDRYQYRSTSIANDDPVDGGDIRMYGRGTPGVQHFGGYIRRIVKRRKKK